MKSNGKIKNKMREIAIANLEIMITSIKSKGNNDHPYLTFLDDAIKVIKGQGDIINKFEPNVKQCFRTSAMYKSKNNILNLRQIQLEKQIKELQEEAGKEIDNSRDINYFDLFYKSIFMMKYLFKTTMEGIKDEAQHEKEIQTIFDFMELHSEKYK